MIVEDDAGTRKSLSMILKNKGYQVTSAVTGEEAISAAKESCFDLGILDIRLPDRLGTELIHPLKEIQPDIILIMATAYASMETAVQALNQGAAAYIYKPYNMDLVLATLREFLEKKLLAEAKKQAEQARNESEERYRSLFEYSLSAFALHEMITDDKGNLIRFQIFENQSSFRPGNRT